MGQSRDGQGAEIIAAQQINAYSITSSAIASQFARHTGGRRRDRPLNFDRESRSVKLRRAFSSIVRSRAAMFEEL
jgi:hypothetical protein